MKNSFSYWEKNTFFEKVDVVIAGSGIVGLFTALEIKRKNPVLKVLILERGVLPNGASTKNAGFCCFGSLSELLDDLSFFTFEDSMSLVELRYSGLQKLRKELGDENLDYQPCGGYELFTENDYKSFNNCVNNIDKYNDYLQKMVNDSVYEITDNKIAEFGFSKNVKYAIKNKFEGSIDTGKAIANLVKKAILNDILILNNVEINKWENNGGEIKIFTNILNIKSGKFIITTNGFASQLIPDLDVLPARAQVLVTSVIPDLKVNGTFHYDRGYNYFRNIHGRILLGGGRNLDFEGETTTEMDTTSQIQFHLEQMLSEVILPDRNFSIEYRWSGIMGVGKEKKPIVREVEKNVFVAVRMGGMGVAIGSKIGEVAAQMVTEKL